MYTKPYFAILIFVFGIFLEFTYFTCAVVNDFKEDYCRIMEADSQANLPVKFQELYTQILKLCASSSATIDDILEFKQNNLTSR